MFVTANGIRIHYELSGRKDVPVVILSDPLAFSLKMWERQMGMLESLFRVLRYDTRGYGEVRQLQPLIRWNF